jgi:4-hydroxybenzoate polyprenyltransferase
VEQERTERTEEYGLNSRSKTFAWLQLLRLPNVFTAVADVSMGYLVTRPELQSTGTNFVDFFKEIGKSLRVDLSLTINFVALAAASCLLYLSGMVLNDVFDARVDAEDRPDRPIPSGRISRRAASRVGRGMFIGGILIAGGLSYWANDWRPGAVAILLGSCILLYDGALKRTRLAPLVMGECRMLNVLLGMSLSIIPWGMFEVLIAVGIGVYIMGVTIFARTDARLSSRVRLGSGFAVLLAGMATVAAVPWLTNERPPLAVIPLGWYGLWVVLALIIGRRCLMAVFDPSPKRVQSAVRNCVQSIIVLDAAVCVGYVSPYWGFAVLALLLPTFALTMWLKAT